MKLTLSENDSFAVINALRVAAERYDEDAKAMRMQSGEGFQSLARAFDEQASHARRIANEIETQDECTCDADRANREIGNHFGDCPLR